MTANATSARRRALSGLISAALVTGALLGAASLSPAIATGTAVSCIENGVAIQPGVWSQMSGSGVPLQNRTPVSSGGTNLIVNGTFESGWGGAARETYRLLPGATSVPQAEWTNSNDYRALPNWNSSGGGPAATTDTYAGWGDITQWDGVHVQDGLSQATPPGDSMVYFGNSASWVWNGTPPTFNADGFGFARPAGSIWMAEGEADSNGFSAQYGDNSSPVRISQTVNLTVGTLYRLQFWQSSEDAAAGSFSKDGVALLDITGYERILFKVKHENFRYTVDFIATDSATTISFGSWGHVDLTIEAGEWNSNATELILDDVILTECATGTGAGPDYVPNVNAVNDYYRTTADTAMTAGAAGGLDAYDLGSTFTKTSNPSHGSVTWDPSNDGTFTYTPAPGYIGTDSFTYRVCLPAPDQAVCDTATQYITIAPPLNARDDYYTTRMDTPMTFGAALTADSYDPSITPWATGNFYGNVTDPAWPTPPIPPSHGTVEWSSANDGTFVYTPDPGWYGTDSFTYMLCESNNVPDRTYCDIATEYIVVPPPGADIMAVNDYYLTPMNTPMTTGDVKTADTYAAGSAFTKISDPVFGTVDWNANGTFTFTPPDDWYGVETFNYMVCLPAPDDAICVTATETITVPPPGVRINAVDDAYTTPLNTEMTVGDVTALDRFRAGSAFTQVSQPAHGTVTWNGDGTFSYMPDADWFGTDSFTYRLCLPSPNNWVCDVATETITVTGPDPVAAVDDYYRTPMNTPMTAGAAAALDTYPSDATFVNDWVSGNGFPAPIYPSHGTVVWDPANDGTFTYTPDTDWYGTDSFTYLLCPSNWLTGADCAVATEYITVPPPVDAVDDYYSTPMNTPMTLGAAKALDSSQIGLVGATLTKTSSPAHGSVTGWNPSTGKFTYTPDKDWYGIDSFTYEICLAAPNQTVCDTATEYITVQPSIVAVDDYYLTPMNTPMPSGAARPLDYSVAKLNGASWTKGTDPSHGTVTGWDSSTGKFTYTPDLNWFGTDSFDYTVCLAAPHQTVCDTATEYIVVPPKPSAKPWTPPYIRDFGVNPAGTKHTFDPMAAGFVASKGATGIPSTLQLAMPGSTNWKSAVTIPGKGTFSVVNGKVRFKGEPGFSGRVTIPYRAQDTSGQWADSELTVLVRYTHPVAKPLERDLGVNIVAVGTRFQAFNAFTPSLFSKGRVSTLSIAPVGTHAWGNKVVVPGKGTFTLNTDGTVSYQGLPCFSGDVTVRYRAQDTTGQWAGSTLTVHVRAPGGKEMCAVN